MQDGAPAHTNKHTLKWLQGHQIHLLNWPGNSPDLNPIEHIWELVKRRLAKKYRMLSKQANLHQAWLDEWDLLSKQDINQAILNQRWAINRVIENKGGNEFHG